MRSWLITSLFIALLAISCVREVSPFKNFEGTWLALDFSHDKASDMVVIKDSVLSYNPLGVTGYKSPLTYNKEKLISYDPHWDEHSSFEIKGDTLIEQTLYDGKTRKFIRTTTENSMDDFWYCDSPLRITLQRRTFSSNQSTLFHSPKSLTSSILIGRLKRGELSRYSYVNPDSICVQVYDALITCDKISRYVNNELENLPNKERDKLVFVLHADVNTPSSFMQTIEDLILSEAKACRVTRAYLDETEKNIRYAEWK